MVKIIRTLKRIKTMKKTTTQDLLNSAVNELRFAMLQILHIKSILQEVEVMTNDVLAKSIIKNGLEKHEMDKLIHTRNIFIK